jgi:hypothetical protein
VAASAREFLGKRRGFGEVHRAYLRGTALEVDTYDWYDLRRRRVQLDEVQRITLHREFRAGALAFYLAIGLLFVAIGALFARARVDVGAWIPFALLGATGLVGALVTVAFPSRVITVTSPRARVVITHRGPRRSRDVFRLLADRTRSAQARPSPTSSEVPTNG